MNIIEYVKAMYATFDESPFNPVDSLVLSQIFYAEMENIKALQTGSCRKAPAIRDFFRTEHFDKMFCNVVNAEKTLELIAFAAANPRFCDIRVKNIVSENDLGQEKQFAAATFVIDKHTEYVCFRGTDETLVGWKEDFNMTFMDQIPSQREAVKYLEKYHKKGRKCYIGGHSKGGNLAVYAAVMSDAAVHRDIIEVFSHDGPGFRDDVLSELSRIAERDKIKINKQVPKSSVVGMLLQSQEEYKVIKSKGAGIMQHSAFLWEIEGNDFIYENDISFGGEYVDRTLHELLERASDDQRQIFINAIFSILVDNEITTLNDLRAMDLKKTKKIIGSYKGLDDEGKTAIGHMLKSLAGAAVSSISRKGSDENA